MTGEVCERLRRRWVCIELCEDYLRGALGRFQREPETTARNVDDKSNYNRIPDPGLLWNGVDDPPLTSDGGRVRVIKEVNGE